MTQYLEIFSVIFGILSVWYARKENILVFPFGIINVSIFIFLFFQKELYANAGINFVYLVTNVYGWYNWSRPKKDDKQLQITKNTSKQNFFFAALALVIYVIVILILRWANKDNTEYLHSYKPWIDTLNTSLFLCATILMTTKKLENWLFWIIGNVVSIPIFLSQGMYFVSLQYAVFLVLAIMGYIEWKKKAESVNVETMHASSENE